MRVFLIAGAAMALSACGSTMDDGMARSNADDTYTICLGALGVSRAATCTLGSGGRIGDREGYCTCDDDLQVRAPVCPTGVTPPAQSPAYEQARLAAARDGSLEGDTYQGQAMCVDSRTNANR